MQGRGECVSRISQEGAAAVAAAVAGGGSAGREGKDEVRTRSHTHTHLLACGQEDADEAEQKRKFLEELYQDLPRHGSFGLFVSYFLFILLSVEFFYFP